MSRSRDREEFVAIMVAEGMPLDVCRAVMRAAASLQRIAELECSSESADRDRVPCPGRQRPLACICEHWRSQDGQRGCGCTSPTGDADKHHPVTRIARREQSIRSTVERICAPYGIKPDFQGDPRGAVVKLKVPSGRTNDWGRVGVCVP
jgi:hypothetical protein